MKFKRILAMVLAGMMTVALAACGAQTEKTETASSENSDVAYVQGNGKMVIGYTIYEPMNYTDESGELTGFDTEFAKAVCEKLEVEPEFVVIDWDNKFLELESKSIDCVWNGMTITDEAKLNASVTNPYVKNAQVVVTSKDNAASITSAEDLKGKKLAAEAGSAGEAAIKDKGLDENYVAVAAQTDALLEVMSGSADACGIDITMANAMTGEGTNYASLAPSIELTTEEYGIAFRKDSDLTAKVNEIMAELKEDGTLSALAEKYSLTLAE